MITSNGYSKDKSIKPEGIVITFGKDMMLEQGGVKHFLRNFLEVMKESETDEQRYWMAKCSNIPTIEVDVVYIIVLNRLWGKVYCGGYRLYNPYAGITDEMDEEYQPLTGLTADGRETEITWNHINLAGPFERYPYKRTLRGFQGFRYCTKLF